MEKVRKFKNEDIISAIKKLEYLRVNLSRIGRLEIKTKDDVRKFLQIQNLFMIESDMYRKLTDVWRVLIDSYEGKEDEELEEILENSTNNWKIPYDLSNSEIEAKINYLLTLLTEKNSK